MNRVEVGLFGNGKTGKDRHWRSEKRTGWVVKDRERAVRHKVRTEADGLKWRISKGTGEL